MIGHKSFPSMRKCFKGLGRRFLGPVPLNTNKNAKSPHFSLLFSKQGMAGASRARDFAWIPSLPVFTWKSGLLMKPGGITSPPHAPVKFHRLQIHGILVHLISIFPLTPSPPLQISSSPPRKRICSPRNAVPASLMGSGPFFFRFFFSFFNPFYCPRGGRFSIWELCNAIQK